MKVQISKIKILLAWELVSFNKPWFYPSLQNQFIKEALLFAFRMQSIFDFFFFKSSKALKRAWIPLSDVKVKYI